MNLQKVLLIFGAGITAKMIFGAGITAKAANSSNSSSTNASDKIDFRGSPLSEALSTRNNNPGNVKQPGTDKWQGTVDYDKKGHVIFDNYVWGSRAMIIDLRSKITKRGLNTINKFLPVYCPASDGCPVSAYIAYVERESGVGRHQALNPNGTLDYELLYKVLQAMANYEGGKYPDGSYKTKFNRWFFDQARKIL